MGKLKSLVLDIPEEVYEEASVGDLLRLIEDDSVFLEKADGQWKLKDGKEFTNE